MKAMKRRAGHRGFVRILAFALGIAPALGLWARAWAGGDHDDDADDAAAQVAPPPSRAEIAKRRREVLEAIRKDDTARQVSQPAENAPNGTLE